MIHTDGKLLTFVRFSSIKNSLIFTICSKIIKWKFGSWNNVFKIYFRNDDHTNVIESEGM